MNEEMIQLICNMNNYTTRGADCHFLKHDDIGIKRYTSEFMSKSAFAAQIFLNKKGLSPKCWGYGSCETYLYYQPRRIYFFFTELATPLENCSLLPDFERELRYKHKVKFHDNCSFNYGLLNDKVCIIDTAFCIEDLVSGQTI